jgi:hypothetical protein
MDLEQIKDTFNQFLVMLYEDEIKIDIELYKKNIDTTSEKTMSFIKKYKLSTEKIFQKYREAKRKVFGEKIESYQHIDYGGIEEYIKTSISNINDILYYWLLTYSNLSDDLKRNNEEKIIYNYNNLINLIFDLLQYILFTYGRETLDAYNMAKFVVQNLNDNIKEIDMANIKFNNPYIIDCKNGPNSYTCGRAIQLFKKNGIKHILIYNTISTTNDFMDEDYAKEKISKYKLDSLEGGYYKNKYLKYKQKYLGLKNNLIGGNWDKLNKLDVLIFFNKRTEYSYQFIGSSSFKTICKRLEINITDLITDLKKTDQPLPEFVTKFRTLISNNVPYSVAINNFISSDESSDVAELFKIIIEGISRKCEVTDFMVTLNKDDIQKCSNKELVKGSCGEPAFFDNIESKENDNDTILLSYFKIIHKYIKERNKSNLIIVLGADKYSEITETTTNSVILYITPNPKWIKELVLSDKIYLNAFFPLAINTPTIKNILEEIININKICKVKIINKMCGTCFRSLYYLVRNKIDYEVNPDQGFTSADTAAIRSCFK